MPPWLAQQRNPAISPYTKGKEQAPVTLKTTVEKKQQSLGEGEKGGGRVERKRLSELQHEGNWTRQ